jgi:hypothetical protein
MRLDINEPHLKRRLFNFDTDTFFFDTNARIEHNRNEKVLPPINNPVSLVGGASDESFGGNVQWAAVSSALWIVSYIPNAKTNTEICPSNHIFQAELTNE